MSTVSNNTAKILETSYGISTKLLKKQGRRIDIKAMQVLMQNEALEAYGPPDFELLLDARDFNKTSETYDSYIIKGYLLSFDDDHNDYETTRLKMIEKYLSLTLDAMRVAETQWRENSTTDRHTYISSIIDDIKLNNSPLASFAELLDIDAVQQKLVENLTDDIFCRKGNFSNFDRFSVIVSSLNLAFWTELVEQMLASCVSDLVPTLEGIAGRLGLHKVIDDNDCPMKPTIFSETPMGILGM